MAKRGKNPVLPHEGVYVRLKPSKIHGVGCFAIRDIPANMDPFKHSNGKMVWFGKNIVKGLPCELRKLYHDFCVGRGNKFGCPKNFNQMDASWYLNHSKKSNMVCRIERGVYNFYTARGIRKGEELTIDYSKYSN